ncbi:hypothetical protein RhiJN_21934 [Ceratobasidium sp. AG-Ba]|nr:hypothetical protein RhiJN_21934 [Ceratobasidium sp. AG-Ba]
MRSSIFAYLAVALAAVSASANKSTIAVSAATSTSLATVTKTLDLTSTVTVSASASSAPNVAASTSISANATSPATTSAALTDLLSATACNTAGVSVVTSVVTQVSTKTVDHFITVTVGSGSNPGSKGQGNLGASPSKPTETRKVQTSKAQQPPPIITTMATVKPVTTVVVEQTTTVFVTSFVTTTVEVKGGATRTHTTMATSTVTSTGMATHTRTKTSTVMITLTKTATSAVTTSTSKGGVKDVKTTAVSSSSPCPTDPVTITVTRSASQTTSKVGIKDSNTSSRIRFSTKTRGTTTLQTGTSSVQSSSSVSLSQTSISAVTTTSARATTRATTARTTSTASRFTTSVVRSSGTVVRANTKTTSAAPSATASAGSDDPQSSLDLDPKVIMSNLAKDGQDTPTAGQVASLTSRNNFINFCLTQKVPLTNGQQVKAGSCNGVPMGRILATDKIPISKFQFPKNGQTIPANKAFTIRMAIKNLKTGNFVNPTTNYYSAPAQTTDDGTLIGHSHCVIEALTSKDQTTPTDPRKFVFFKGLNLPDVNGVLTADVTAGLPAGEYRISSINSAANHQPALPAVAQRGSVDDISYFTVA